MSGRAGAFSAGQSDRVRGLSLAACRSVHDRSARVLAAANTAASWARARRATWDDALTAAVHPEQAEAATLVIPFQQAPSIPIEQTRPDVRPIPRVPFENTRRVAVGETAGRRESAGSWLSRWLWLPSGSVAAVGLALGGTARAFWLRPPQPAPTRPAVVTAKRAR